MTHLSARQIAKVAAGVGFKGAGLNRAVAVAMAESGGNPNARHVNADKWHSVDRGLWQINSHWHPEVPDSAAYDPIQAAVAAQRISNNGADWSAWSTWKNGSAQALLPAAKLASAGMAKAVGPQTGGKAPKTRKTKNSSKAAGSSATATDTGLSLGGLDGGLKYLEGPGGWALGLGEDLGGSLFGDGGPGVGGIVGGVKDSADAAKQGLVYLAHASIWIANPHNWARVGMVVGGGGAVLMGAYLLAKSGAAGSTAQNVAGSAGRVAKDAAGAVALA